MNNTDDVVIIVSAQDKFSVEMKRIEEYARDTKKKLDKETVYKLKANVAALDLALKDARAKIKKATSEQARWRIIIETQELQRQLTEAKRKLNNYLNTWDEKTSRLQAKFDSLWGTIKEVFSGGGLQALDSFLGKIPMIWTYLQVALAAVVAFWKALSQAGKNAQEFEDAFAGVRKTVDDSEENLRKIEKGLIDMSKRIPMAVKELWAIAEMGGQLGVPTQDLLTFTEAVAMLSVSTNLTSEAAATDFARISNITQEPLKNIDRMGSTVVALGNNFATTEREIVNFTTNIAGAGEIVGLTTPQIFAISTAFTSVGIEAEAGGTATQKVLLAINNAVNKWGKELQAYARISGQSADEFKKNWKDNAGEGFLAFVQGLQNAGQDANLVLEEMGLKDVRLQKAFLSLANAGDLLNNALATANLAREENNALQEEADKRFQTTTSQIQIQKNKWQAFSAQFGMVWNAIRVPVFTWFTDFFTNTLPTASNNIGIFFENTFQLIFNFWRNIWKAVNNLPAAFTSATNATLWVLEKFINNGISGLNSFIGLIKKIPGVSDIIGNLNLWTINLWRVSWPQFEWIGLTDWFKEFESFSKNHSKQYEIAAWKVKEGIKKEIQTEVDMLSDIQNILDDKKWWSAKSKTENLKKELEKQKQLEIQAVKDSELTEEAKMLKIYDIKERYDKKTKELEGKTDDDLLKQSEEYMKSLKEQREQNYKDHKKKADEASKDIKKYTENLDKIKKKFEEIKEKAGESLRSVKHDLDEMDKTHIKDLGARYYEVKKQIRDNESDNPALKYLDAYNKETLQKRKEAWTKEVGDLAIDKILEQLKLKEELLYLEKKTTKEQQEQAKIEAEKSESVKLVEKYEKEKRIKLEHQRLLESYTASGEVGLKGIDYIRDEHGDKTDKLGYRDAEKKAYIEITDFKNQEYARDLLNQQTKLAEEYASEQKKLNDSKELALKHSQEIIKIWENETQNYRSELLKRADITRDYVNQVKAMMAEINQAKSNAQGSVINNNQTTNSNNKTTNYHITNVGSTSRSFPGGYLN